MPAFKLIKELLEIEINKAESQELSKEAKLSSVKECSKKCSRMKKDIRENLGMKAMIEIS